MKFITLLSAAYVGGVLRHPHEGSIPVSDADAKRLVDDEKLAEDVTEGFSDEQVAEVPEEAITIASGQVPAAELSNPHLSQVAPAATPEAKPARKGAASKE
ncbi:hypothetical protein [Sphingomonas faeni]|uniref:hypothetical protein n=1 Tax=Sphingomonas faeni TaxID=185950 RepID=UPI003352179C